MFALNFSEQKLFWGLEILLFAENKVFVDYSNIFKERKPNRFLRVRVILFNATFNNISVILWWSVLLMEETCCKSLTYFIT